MRSCKNCEFDRVGSCKENCRRNARYLIELERSVRRYLMLVVVRRIVRYLIELRAVRSLFGEFEVFD